MSFFSSIDHLKPWYGFLLLIYLLQNPTLDSNKIRKKQNPSAQHYNKWSSPICIFYQFLAIYFVFWTFLEPTGMYFHVLSFASTGQALHESSFSEALPNLLWNLRIGVSCTFLLLLLNFSCLLYCIPSCFDIFYENS